MKAVVVAILMGVFNRVLADPMRFDNSPVLKVAIEHLSQLTALQDLRQNGSSLYFLDEPTVGRSVQIIVPPSLKVDFKSACDNNRIDSQLLCEDIQKLIDAETNKGRDDEFHFDEFHRIEKTTAWLDSLPEKWPSIVTRLTGGLSHFGRKIDGVRLSKNATNPAVFIESNIHAREWLASATAIYMINELLTSQDSEVQDLLNKYNWYIFPHTNPDGYIYSKDRDRMWRKNMAPSDYPCEGVDLNRNWDYEWKLGGEGNNANPCGAEYPGPWAFSEMETRTLADFIRTVPNLKVYLSFHSAYRAILTPWGHTKDKSPHYERQMKVAKATVTRLEAVHGVKYRYGPVSHVLFIATGGSISWTYGHLNVTWSFAYEFREKSTDGTWYGFVPPPSEIKPNADETIQSVIGMLKRIESIEGKTTCTIC